MMHVNRCGNHCQSHITPHAKYPAGACVLNGAILRIKPEVRMWIDTHGCCVYRAPISDIIDADAEVKG